jgi:LmbE family N-acetylglucosaminyl deacetylase
LTDLLYIAPHADDETLSMGASIRAHLEAGHDPHVLLCTTGVNSGARAATGLSREAFTAARDDEFLRACRALGVWADKVIIPEGRPEDGALSASWVTTHIEWWISQHPGGWVKTYSQLPLSGRHGDHVAVGQAAVGAVGAGVLTRSQLRLYVEPWLVSQFKAAHKLPMSADSPSGVERVRNALDEYEDVDHVGGRYGIGGLSVPTFFDLVRSDPRSHYHLPPA